MKKELDWKDVGQFISFLVSVFVIIRDTFKKMKIGIEIIPWLTGEGKEIFEKFLKSLGEEWLKQKVVIETAIVETVVHLIDCDADPFRPGGWKIVEHKKGGQFQWDLAKILLFLFDIQSIKGNELRKKLKGMLVLNANVLDYLLAHPELIPEEWKGKYIFFWGTIYCDSVGCLVVRCLHWNGVKWCWRYLWLGIDFHSGFPAAVLRAS
mgnify:CR=1 FL=1